MPRIGFREIFVAVLASSFVFFCLAAQSHYRRETIWLLLLFLLPIAVQFRSVFILFSEYHKTHVRNSSAFYLLTMSISLVSYCVLWWVYACYEKKYGWLNRDIDSTRYYEMLRHNPNLPSRFYFLSGLAVILILVLILLAVRLTRAIIDGNILNEGALSGRRGWKFWNLDYLRTFVNQAPSLALAFFFTVFLGVSYLFGLALAFYDKASPPSKPALYLKNLDSLRPTPSPQILATNSSPTQSPTPTATPTATPEEFTFHFIEGFAAVPLPGVNQLNYPPNLKDDWLIASEINSSHLEQEDVKSLPLARSLQARNDPVSQFIYPLLSADTRRWLNEYVIHNMGSTKELQALIDDLNEVIEGTKVPEGTPSPAKPQGARRRSSQKQTVGQQVQLQCKTIYKESVFVTLPEETSRLTKKQLDGPDCQRLNRRLLAEAYPEHIRKEKLDSLIDLITESMRKHERLRVAITGFSDTNQVQGRAYQSNFELAEARAQNIKQTILQRLTLAPNRPEFEEVEWAVVSLSNELQKTEKMVKVELYRVPPDSAQLLLMGQHANSLTLLDYVYFANYTITTTGYGDIIPTTPYARFICSFANIVEVFFLVVFFNVLLSVRRGNSPTEEHVSSDGADVKQQPAANDIDQTVIAELRRASEDNRTFLEQSLKTLRQSYTKINKKLKELEVSFKDKLDRPREPQADIEAEIRNATAFKNIEADIAKINNRLDNRWWPWGR